MTALARTGCSTDSVDVCLAVLRDVEIQNDIYVGNIETSRGDIGGDKNVP